MKLHGGKRKIKSNSGLAIVASLAVVFMFVATIFSIILYKKRMDEASALMVKAQYSSYDSYVVMIASDGNSDFWEQMYDAASEYGKDYGVYVDMFSESIDESYSKLEYFEMAIEADCDAIFIEGENSEEFSNLLNKANKKSIAVFTIQTDVDVENRVSYIGTNSYTIAGLYRNSIIENITNQKRAMVVGNDSDATSTFTNNLQNALSELELPNGPLEIESRVVAGDEAFATEQYVQNLFKENDLAPIVICLDEEITESFYQAMIDYNKVGQVLLFANNSSSTILTGIKQGVIVSTVFVDPANIGEAVAAAFVEYRDSGYVSDYINVEAKLIDANNIQEEFQEVDDE